jgi:beta-glucosidase
VPTSGVRKYAMACAKHYALISVENTQFFVDVTIDEEVARRRLSPSRSMAG